LNDLITPAASADTQKGMKSLIVLFAGEITENAFVPLGSGRGSSSAAERALDWACSLGLVDSPDGGAITLFSSGELDVQGHLNIPEKYGHVTVVQREQWTIAGLLAALAECSAGYDAIIYGWMDCPFYDRELTLRLLEKHIRYAAEYTFADGYPEGLTPELLAPGTAAILASLAKENDAPVTRDALFSVLKKDINSFEIETDIAPQDLRYLRLTLACDTKRNTLQCMRLAEEAELGSIELNAEAITAIVASSLQVLRTLPAFYNVQISGRCPVECSYCPYPAMCGEGGVRTGSVLTRTDFMSLSAFRELVSRIASFSGDAVIALSLWGEALLHPDFLGFIKAVLEYPSLSVLVETTGLPLTQEMADTAADIVAAAPPRTNGQNPVNWIISIDAATDSTYRLFRPRVGEQSLTGLEKAVTATEMLLKHFPGAVWPQFVRMQDNEDEMEGFYRFWKEKAGNVIIQKYDWFCGVLADKKSTDLSPIRRNPCWHLRRDMAILADGTVPLCREDIGDGSCNKPMGNVFTDTLEDIWGRGSELFKEQLKGCYNGICGKGDEYYTVNF
jgi:spiro-SPASM protein